MPLESATYISDLEVSNPAATDLLRQADDHIRLIKSVLKNTFPNLDAAVTSTSEELSTPPFGMPIGFIGVWYGSALSVPSGWAICNGQTVSRSDGDGTIVTPDLRDRVVIGAGTLAQGVTAGAASASVSVAPAGAHVHTVAGTHSHTVTISGTALTVEQLPAHKHGSGLGGAADNAGAMLHGSKSASATESFSTDADDTTLEAYTETVGGGQAHSHSGVAASVSINATSSSNGEHTHSAAVSTIQPVLALHHIMKI